MSGLDIAIKRAFDFCCALAGLLVLWPVILVSIILAGRDTKASGLFRQERIGKDGEIFNIYKIRTMRDIEGTTVTTTNDTRITKLGNRLRRYKLDELPQLWNVLIGDMSLVGPRPDVQGFADSLTDSQKSILKLRPGITGPATLKYKAEEHILSTMENPEQYNRDVIWPDKVAINLEYIESYSFMGDIKILFRTVFGK